MEYKKEKKEIILDKETNNLDKFVIDFCSLLKNYVIVSGYVSILFGRSRATEDVDLLVEKMTFSDFQNVWKRIYRAGFECINTDDSEKAFSMMAEHAIRFSRKGIAIPNIEFKEAKKKEDHYSLKNKIKVLMGKKVLFISPLEMQIAYKLDLGKGGNDKDLEDAKHLYELFKEKLNKNELLLKIKEFKAEKEFEKIK